jgi:predicted porin
MQSNCESGENMKSSILRLAVLGTLAAPAVAFAQSSNVTLYGRANVSVEATKAGTATIVQVVNNASRLGLRGFEDIGGGAKVVFQIESSVNMDSGGGAIAGRDTWLGLESNWGTFRAGRMTSALYYATRDSLPENNHDTGNASDALFGQAQNTQTAAAYGGGRFNNAIYYSTPRFAGFKVEATYAALTETSVPTRPGHSEIALQYENGPFYFGTGYTYTKTANTTTTSKAEYNKAFPILAVYDFKAAVVGVGYERAERELPGTGTVHRNYWRVAGMVPVGAHEFHVSYGDAGDVSGQNDSGAKEWIVGYNYNLSKRAKVYAFYVKVDNDRNGAYGFLTNTPGVDNSSFAVGMRLNF